MEKGEIERLLTDADFVLVIRTRRGNLVLQGELSKSLWDTYGDQVGVDHVIRQLRASLLSKVNIK